MTRQAPLFQDVPMYRREFLVDGTWFCEHCHGPALFKATEGLPMKVQFVGYEHKIDCPELT